jgi:hypothetical protein
LEYIVVKSTNSGNEIVATIGNKHITSVYDYSYVGGKAEYRVDLKTSRRDQEGIATGYDDEAPEGSFSWPG